MYDRIVCVRMSACSCMTVSCECVFVYDCIVCVRVVLVHTSPRACRGVWGCLRVFFISMCESTCTIRKVMFEFELELTLQRSFRLHHSHPYQLVRLHYGRMSPGEGVV